MLEILILLDERRKIVRMLPHEGDHAASQSKMISSLTLQMSSSQEVQSTSGIGSSSLPNA